MPLPSMIEIVPPPAAVSLSAEVTVPGSKSITNRALIMAALSLGPTTLSGALWSEDTRVMVDGLRRLGFVVDVEADAAEEANRVIRVRGQGGRIPLGGTPVAPLELFVGNAGTAARFFAALVCLGHGVYRLSGVGRMHERPQAELFAALRALGYRVDSPNDRLPAVLHGSGPRAGACTVRVQESSQFASALLLCARAGGWEVRVEGDDDEELPYVEMTRRLVLAFPSEGGEFEVEPDASSGSYFWAAGHLVSGGRATHPSVRVRHWPTSGWQIDQAFPRFLGTSTEISRRHDLGDSIMTAIVLAPFGRETCRFTDLRRLRVQESERVIGLRTELGRCGASVQEIGDSLEIRPSTLHGAEVETYDDHRMAMCFAVVGLKVRGIRIRNPACVRKTFPNFFAKLAAPPPLGLGVEILEPQTRRRMDREELASEASLP